MKIPSKPKGLEKYEEWLKKEYSIELNDRLRNYYETVATKIKRQFEESEYWIKLCKSLKEFEAEYRTSTGYPLLMPNFKLELGIKPYESFLIKTYRKNILENKNWPNPPEPTKKWILPNSPSTWYPKINDIARTLIVVKYLDGVEFLANKLLELAEDVSIKSERHYVVTDDGYYAVHIYLTQDFEVPKLDWDTEEIKLKIEIQIMTQLQEVIRQLLHKYYEKERLKLKTTHKEIDWRWNYKSDKFRASYIGHMLHYIEGVIVELRDRLREEYE